MRLGLLLALWCGGAAAAIAEPSTIFLVRHAERADAGGIAQKDPALSATGRARAAALGQTLGDAGIKAIYVTEFRRTQETAKPLADKLHLQPSILPARETAALIAQLQRAEGNVLVIGHSNTLPEIAKALGSNLSLVLGEQDYDDLFIVQRVPAPQLLRLHYR